MALDNEFTQLSAEDQAQLDQMRAGADAADDASADDRGAPAADVPPVTEPQADPTIQQQPQPGQRAGSQTVPLAHLLDERRARQGLEQQLAAERQRFDERLNQVLQRLGPPPQAAGGAAVAEIPALDKDPVGHFMARLEQLGTQVQQMNQGAQQQQRQNTTTATIQAVQARAGALEREFMAATPDYSTASEFLQRTRHDELAALGFADPLERQQIISNEAFTIAARAIQQGANPAEWVYKVAQHRGYKAPAAAPPPGSDAGERIQQQQQGRQQGRSLGAVRGAAPSQMTAQRIIEMNDADFARELDKRSANGTLADIMGA